MPSVPETFVISGGSLDSSVPNLVNANNNAQTWNASFGFVGSQNLNLGSGSVTMTANLTLTVSSNTLEVGGPVTTANTLTKAGAGTLVLGAPNSFTGVTINGGVIALGDDGALGAGTAGIQCR
jgi:autotransporter-associated beta strand protein